MVKIRLEVRIQIIQRCFKLDPIRSLFQMDHSSSAQTIPNRCVFMCL